jgi:hypothetical protein
VELTKKLLLKNHPKWVLCLFLNKEGPEDPGGAALTNHVAGTNFKQTLTTLAQLENLIFED